MFSPRHTLTWAVILLFSLLASRWAYADAATEKKVLDDIRAENPDAAPVYEKAIATLDQGDMDQAHTLLRRVTELAPKSDHAYRRLCRVELVWQSDRADAVADCRRALALRDAPENQLMLARALVEPESPSPESIAEASEHASLALAAKPDDPHVLNAMVRVQIARKDVEHANLYVEQLEEVAPRDPQTLGLLARVRLLAGDTDGAYEALDEAEKRGLPTIQVSTIRSQIEGPSVAWPWIVRFAKAACFWILGFVALSVVGWILSQIVLLAATKAPAFVLRVYRSLIWLACVYFYASLPILLLGVLIMAGLALWAMFHSHNSNGQGVGMIVVLAFFTAAAVTQAIWAVVRPPSREDPGEELDLTKEPGLRALLDEVANRMGTRTVDRVFLTSESELAVTERGAGWRARGGERILILGVAILDGMPLRGFKALLAHEYGHFKNEDTAAGFAHAMRHSLFAMMEALAEHGVARWYSPAWLFVRGFQPVFSRISFGASRLQEILADRGAALAYGSAWWERGFRHGIERSVRFNAQTHAAMYESTVRGTPLVNVYAYGGLEALGLEARIREVVDATLGNEVTEPHDNHPPNRHRIAWVQAMATAGEPAGPHDEIEAWSLFENRTHIEERMTERLRTKYSKTTESK